MHSDRKSWTLDIVLQYAQRNSISTLKYNDERFQGCHFPYDSKAVILGERFAFQVHSHDTGNSVRGYILTDNKPYEIVSATYWKVSGYEFNKDKWEKGAWDNVLSRELDNLKVACTQHYDEQQAIEQQTKAQKSQENQTRKSEVEALFS